MQSIRGGFFYLLDYVKSTEIFQIGDRKKKKKHGPHLSQFLHSLLTLSEVLKFIFSVISNEAKNEQFCSGVMQNPFFIFFEISVFQIGG